MALWFLKIYNLTPVFFKVQWKNNAWSALITFLKYLLFLWIKQKKVSGESRDS